MFWQGVALIVRLRGKLALRSCARNVATLLGLAFALLVGGPASFAAARICHVRLESASPPAGASGVLTSTLLVVQAIFLLLLLPELYVTVGHSLPPKLLRPLPARPMQIVVAGALGSILDVPVLFSLPVLWTVARWAGQLRGTPGALTACLAVFLLLLQTAALSQVIEPLRRWVKAARCGGVLAAAGVVFLLASFYGSPGPMRATAAPTPAQSPFAPASLPTFWTTLLPGGMAAKAVMSAVRGDWGNAVFSLFALASLAPATLWIGARLYTASEAYESAPLPPLRRKDRPLSPSFADSRLSLAAAVFGLEWRCLVRSPASYLPLRGPAMLLLTVFLGWVAPNVGDDPILTLRDLTAMGALVYMVLCQIQLLCNRFGNEMGTTGLLLRFPAKRRYLLMGKNTALICLLLPLDSAILLLLCAIAHAAPTLVATALGATATGIAVMTSLGNLVSVLVPFPIAKRGGVVQVEPERSLIVVYLTAAALSGGAGWALLLLREKTSDPVTIMAGVIGLAGLYAGSLLAAERLLLRRELRLIALLEGGDLA